jgi:hypothetical protein
MSESVQNLIQAIADGNALDTEQAFGAAMAEKLSGKLNDMRATVAQSMFVTPEPVTENPTEE